MRKNPFQFAVSKILTKCIPHVWILCCMVCFEPIFTDCSAPFAVGIRTDNLDDDGTADAAMVRSQGKDYGAIR